MLMYLYLQQVDLYLMHPVVCFQANDNMLDTRKERLVSTGPPSTHFLDYMYDLPSEQS